MSAGKPWPGPGVTIKALNRRELLTFATLKKWAAEGIFACVQGHMPAVTNTKRAWDLDKACTNRDIPLRLAISAERDRYPKHHLGLGGIAWVICVNRATSNV
jgi:hypothetical protein